MSDRLLLRIPVPPGRTKFSSPGLRRFPTRSPSIDSLVTLLVFLRQRCDRIWFPGWSPHASLPSKKGTPLALQPLLSQPSLVRAVVEVCLGFAIDLAFRKAPWLLHAIGLFLSFSLSFAPRSPRWSQLGTWDYYDCHCYHHYCESKQGDELGAWSPFEKILPKDLYSIAFARIAPLHLAIHFKGNASGRFVNCCNWLVRFSIILSPLSLSLSLSLSQ